MGGSGSRFLGLIHGCGLHSRRPIIDMGKDKKGKRDERKASRSHKAHTPQHSDARKVSAKSGPEPKRTQRALFRDSGGGGFWEEDDSEVKGCFSDYDSDDDADETG